jgi:hypothetical protein
MGQLQGPRDTAAHNGLPFHIVDHGHTTHE